MFKEICLELQKRIQISGSVEVGNSGDSWLLPVFQKLLKDGLFCSKKLFKIDWIKIIVVFLMGFSLCGIVEEEFHAISFHVFRIKSKIEPFAKIINNWCFILDVLLDSDNSGCFCNFHNHKFSFKLYQFIVKVYLLCMLTSIGKISHISLFKYPPVAQARNVKLALLLDWQMYFSQKFQKLPQPLW